MHFCKLKKTKDKTYMFKTHTQKSNDKKIGSFFCLRKSLSFVTGFDFIVHLFSIDFIITLSIFRQHKKEG